jgi:predicted O-methyltransferase YrrM
MFSAILKPSRYSANARYFWARWHLHRRGILDELAKRPSDAKPPSYYELWYLYRMARGRRRLLEFGIGCSTVVLAKALHDQGGGELISVDASSKWIEISNSTFPSALRPFVKFHHSPLVMMDYAGEPCHRYVDVPTTSPDLVYLDGPAPKDVPGWRGTPVAADPLLLDLQPNSLIIVDSRQKNVAFLERHLRRPFRSEQDRAFGITTFVLG